MSVLVAQMGCVRTAEPQVSRFRGRLWSAQGTPMYYMGGGGSDPRRVRAGMRRRCGLFPDYFGHLFGIFIGVCKRWQTRRAIFDLSNLQFILVRQRDGYIAVTEQFPRLTSAPSPEITIR